MTKAIYADRPILVDRSTNSPATKWPVRYVRMLDMANDSGLFLSPSALRDEGAYPVHGNIWKKGATEYLPLYEGKMVQAFDHRASDILLAEGNLFRTGQGRNFTAEDHRNPGRLPVPRYWVESQRIKWSAPTEWCLAVKDVTSVTNARTSIATIMPRAGAGHTLPVIFPEDAANQPVYVELAVFLLANFNSVILDYLTRQKVHGNHLAWYLIEQLPILGDSAYRRSFGSRTAAEIVREAVLELTYTAHDMAAFAKDVGYVDASGAVQPPFIWDDERRLRLRAKLDAVYFHLYDVTDRDDVRYIYSTFPIVEREEIAKFGRYRSRDLCLAYISALSAGDPDAVLRV